MKKTPTTDIWFIGRNQDNSVIHYAFNPANHQLGCGQPIYEEFDNETAWFTRLSELGITP